MYNKEEIPETPFMKIKCGLKLSLINLFSIQFIFYTLALVFIELSSHFQLSSKYGFTNPRELSAFAFDMWFIAFIFSACLFVGVFINKIKRIPLYFLLSYPATLIFFALIRDVFLYQIIIFSLASCFLVLKVNYQRFRNIEFSNA